MRLGATQIIRLEKAPETTFEVRTSFGARRKYLANMAQVLELDGTKGQLGAVDATLEFLADVLVNWRGIEDAEGTPLSYRPELLAELPEWMLTELVSQIVAGDVDQGNVVSGSPSPPETFSEGKE